MPVDLPPFTGGALAERPYDIDPASLSVKQASDEVSSGVPPGPDPVVESPGQPNVELLATSPGPTLPPYEPEDNHQVRRFLDRFQAGYRRSLVESWLARAGRYLPMVLEVFRQKGLPEELVFTAMIESGFNPIAVSRAGAKGLWQFMAPTARRYGLRVDRWMDERLDPEKSTVAAANHLLDLYAVFGSWNLVHAAYNAGEMKVVRAIRGMGTTDFWTLTRGRHLKEETKNFVPAIHAVSLIAREPDRYGFVVTPEDPLRYDLVQVPHSTALQRIAGLSGLSLDEIERLNPELRLKQTPPGSAYTLKVPIGGAMRVQVALEGEVTSRTLASVPRGSPVRAVRARSPDFHVVKARETVGGIARRYRVSVEEIARWNKLEEMALIRPGDRLRVASLSPSKEDRGSFR